MANQPDTGPRKKPGRPVLPRKPRHLDKKVIAIDGDDVLLEDGTLLAFSELPLIIRTQPSSILIAHHFGRVIRYLDKEFEGNDLWQFRASPVERSAWAPNRKRQAQLRDCIIGYIGFKGENKKKGHYHYPLSPHTFCLKSVNELRRGIPDESATIIKLMEWGKEVRKFLQDNDLNLSPTSGGIAAQLLKDGRFYPNPRRKVPRHTNALAREHLPGNFYRLYDAKESKDIMDRQPPRKAREIDGKFQAPKLTNNGPGYKATYLDQTSAHHVAASKLQFPCANTLERYGRYSTLKDRSFAKHGTDKFNKIIKYHGLFYLAIEVPRFFDNDFPLPECESKEPGYKRGFFYSNEIPYLLELGVRIRHIIAAWVSPDVETGLNKYADWAMDEIKLAHRNSKPWLKPTLLSTYGVLAAKPKLLEFGYKRAEGGEPKRYPCGSGFIDVQAKASTKLREPLMANVIHRGMIEAQTRLESLKFARELAKQGHSILAIYADSIFVADGKPLPLLPFPWRIQEYLTGLKFESATHFTSAQLSKTPGVPAHMRGRSKLPARPKPKANSAT